MSNTETTTEPTNVIPGDDVERESSNQSWRFANGKIVRGKEKTEQVVIPSTGETTEVKLGTYPEEIESVTGLLDRLWVADYHHEKFGRIYKLEADIQTRDHGMRRIACKLLDTKGEVKVSISALNFAWCLLQFKKGDALRIETVLGKPIVKDGVELGSPTYVNAFTIEGNKAKPLYRPRRDADAPKQTPLEQWRELEPQLKAHNAWAERDTDGDEGDGGSGAATHLSELCRECDERGWISPQKSPGVWLEIMQGFHEEAAPRASLSSFNDDAWGEVRLRYNELLKEKGAGWTPSKLAAAAKAAAEADPFEKSSSKSLE